MRAPPWSFAAAHIVVHIIPPEGVVPSQFSAFVERKALEIEAELKELARRQNEKVESKA